MRTALWGFLMTTLAGCSSGSATSFGSGQSASIDGLYTLHETVTQSSCASVPVGQQGTDTMTVTTSNGEATETLDSITGSCSGPINGDSVTWACQVTGSNGTFTLQVEATFGNGTVQGTAVLGGSCQITDSFTGTSSG